MKTTDESNPNHILIGLGGTGGKVLKAFRKRLFEEFPKSEDRKKLPIGFVYVDSTDEMMKVGDATWRVFGQNAQFEQSEFVNIKSIDLSQIMAAPETYPGLAHVVKNGEMMRRTLGEVGAAAGQKRRAGRILFASHINQYLSAVHQQYEKVKAISDKNNCNIHIFTGLAGGTGSGSIIDAVAQLRSDALFQSNEDAVITVYAMIPELSIPTGCQAGRYHQNGYAALSELSALNVASYLPCDVLKGNEHVSIKTDPLKQFGLMVYSNVNENGSVVNSFTELPKLLADTIYFSVFLKVKPGENETFVRSLTCENFNDYSVEKKFGSREEDNIRTRTKAVSSFGIKRIVYPEQRVVEHISYTLADSVFSQMSFNNYKEDFGFVREAQKKDYRQLYLMDKSLMRQWKLDDSFLTLNERIYDTDQPFDPIADFWSNEANFWDYDSAKAQSSNPLNYLQTEILQNKFDKSFRLDRGVVEYYKDKSDDKLLKEQAEYIVELIEQSLYTQWYEGSLSLNDLLHIADELLMYIRNRRTEMAGELSECDKRIEEFRNEAEANMMDYSHLSLAQKAIGRAKDRYTDHQAILADLYTERTLRVAKEFAQKLLGKLQVAFEEFHDQVQSFVGALALCMDEAAKRISDRNQQQGSIKDMKQAVIEVREDDKVAAFEKSLLLNKNTMTTIAGTLRHELVGNLTFAHFDALAKEIKIDKAFDVIDRVMGEKVREIHDTGEYTKEKLIGINILQQLQKVLATDDDIRRFAKEAVEKSGVFILLDNAQLTQAHAPNPNPVANPETMNRKAILVTMPPADGDDSLKEFVEKLKDALRGAFGNATAYSKIEFDTIGETMNEITIAAVKCCFPLRAVKWLSEYEREYNDLIKHSVENRILLHSEGDGSQLPPLMGEKQLSAQEFIPYYFLSAAMGILNLADDEVNGRGWCITRYDAFGSPINLFLSRQFTELSSSESMTPSLRSEIEQKVSDIVKSPELTIAKRNEYAENVKTLMRETVAGECSSTTSQKYQQYSAYAMKALEMITKK